MKQECALKAADLSKTFWKKKSWFALFPVGRALQGREKWILYFTPLLITATLPRLAAVYGNPTLFALSIVATAGLYLIALLLFNFGLKLYKSKNYVFINE